MSLFDSILKAAKAEGYGEDEVRRAVTDGVGELFVRTKQKGIDDEVVKAKLDTFGLPPELYTRPEDAGGNIFEKTKDALAGFAPAAEAAGAAIKDLPGQAKKAAGLPGKAIKAVTGPAAEAPDIPDPIKKMLGDYGVKMGVTMAKEQMEKIYGPSAAHYMNAFVSGQAAAAADLGRTVQWLGFDAGEVVSTRARQIEKELADPASLDHAQEFAKSAGYLSTLFLPGVGIEAAAGAAIPRLGMAIPRLATWLGVSPTVVAEASAKAAQAYMSAIRPVAAGIARATGAAPEAVAGSLSTVRMLPAEKIAGMVGHTALASGVNAGSVYERSLAASPEDKELANARASAVFWGSLPVSVISSHFFPGPQGGVARQAFQGALSQGSVVASWHMISNMAMNDPILSGVLHSFANGAVFGAVFTGAGAALRAPGATGPEPVVEPRPEPVSRMKLTAEGEAPKTVTPDLVPPEPTKPSAQGSGKAAPPDKPIGKAIGKAAEKTGAAQRLEPDGDMATKLLSDAIKKPSEHQADPDSPYFDAKRAELAVRFEDAQEVGISDAELKKLISEINGPTDTGFWGEESGYRMTSKKGSPVFQYGPRGVEDKDLNKLEGKALLDAARKALGFPQPTGVKPKSADERMEAFRGSYKNKMDARPPLPPSKPLASETAGLTLKPRYGVEGDESVESGGQWGDLAKGSAKAQFKSDSLKILKAAGKDLGLDGKASFNPAGPAVSGEATGTFLGPDGRGVYISIGEGSVPGLEPHAQGLAIMFRSATKEDPYGTKSNNNWLPASADHEQLVAAIKKTLTSGKELAKAAHPPFEAKPSKTASDAPPELREKLDSIPFRNDNNVKLGKDGKKETQENFKAMKTALLEAATSGTIPPGAAQQMAASAELTKSDAVNNHYEIETPDYTISVRGGFKTPDFEIGVSDPEMVKRARAIEPKPGTSVTAEAIARFSEYVKHQSAFAKAVEGSEAWTGDQRLNVEEAIAHFTDPASEVLKAMRAVDGPAWHQRAIIEARGEDFILELGWPTDPKAIYQNLHTAGIAEFEEAVKPMVGSREMSDPDVRREQIPYLVAHWQPATELESKRRLVKKKIEAHRKELKGRISKERKRQVVNDLEEMDAELLSIEKAINAGANKGPFRDLAPLKNQGSIYAPQPEGEPAAEAAGWKKGTFDRVKGKANEDLEPVQGTVNGPYGVYRQGKGKKASWDIIHTKTGLRAFSAASQKDAQDLADHIAQSVPELSDAENPTAEMAKKFSDAVTSFKDKKVAALEVTPESPYAGTKAQPGSRYEAENEGGDLASTMDETETGLAHQKNDLEAVTEMLESGKDLKGKPLKPAQVKALESEKAQLEGDIDSTLAEVEQAAGEDAAEKMRSRVGLPSEKPAKKDLKTKKARAKLDVEGEKNHGQQFEVQDDVGEVVVRPEDGRGEGEEDGGVGRRASGPGEPPVGPGGGGVAVPADAVPADTRLSVAKPIELTPSQRRDINAKALAILEKSLDQVTEVDREILRQYTGVGGLQAEEEGVLNQHYTSYQVIKFIWDKLAAMGVPFKGAKALEAAEGVGNFLGFKPEGVEFDAVELDERASRISTILYPSVKHHNMPFEKFVPSYGYDISIGNDPFGDFRGKERYADEAAVYQDIGAIHDFFIMKRVDLLNPNGVLAVITSTGTMDKMDPKTRARINAKAEFLGAYRLPQGTFKKNAGFDGSVDLMFFRKRVAEEIGKKELLQQEFIETDTIPLKFGTGDQQYEAQVHISSYYKAHPENVIGKMVAGGRYQNRAEAVLPKGHSIVDALHSVMNDSIKLVPKATKVAKAQGGYIEDKPNLGDAPDGAAVGSYVIKEGKLAVVGASGKLFDTGRQVKSAPRAKAALEMMAMAESLMNQASEFGSVHPTMRKALLKKVQAYFNEHKVAPGYDRMLTALRDDPSYFKLAGIMNDAGQPADILTKDNIFPEAKKIKPAKAGDLKDAIRYATEKGTLSSKAVAEIYGQPQVETAMELVKKHGWNLVRTEAVPDSEYLAGDLWPKIDAAREAGLQGQVQKLMDALPEQKTIKDVPASLLHAWLPQSARDGFLAHAGISGKLVRAKNPESGRLEWTIDGGSRGSMNELAVNGNTPAETILKYLNHQKEYKPDPEDYRSRILDREATEKLKVVDQEFEKYLRTVAADGEDIVNAYNRSFRSYKRKAPDASPADLPGISSTFKGRPLSVKSHQWEWVRMATEQRASINAHGVGSGKTMAGALAGQMASIHNGAKRKLYAVPAKVLHKWAYEIQQLFPGAKVLSLEDLSSANAYKMLQQVAMNEFDFALISHDRLKMIPLKSAEKYLEEDLAELRDRLLQIKKSKARKNLRTERDIQERLVKMEEKLRGLQQMAKTNTIFWEDLNIDLIAVDEAHNYKRVNVDYGTYANESHISGGNQSSDRANDLWYKTREMRDRQKGNILFLTATPTTNRPIEIYSAIRFLSPEEWTSRGIMNAQDFIDYFAVIEQKLVPDLDGVMVEKTLITGYKNLHDLRAIVGKYVDYRPVADLKEVMRPDGSYTIVEVPISETQKRILAKIVADLEYVTKDPRGAQAEGINKMSLTTAGRQAAVGADIYDAESYRDWTDKNSKIAYALDKVTEIHKKKNAGQLIFLDMFRGYKKTARPSPGEKAAMEVSGEKVKVTKPEVLVNYHERIRDMLVKRGIKAKDIAIVNGEVNNTPAAKQKVAEDYNAGRLKVVIGTTTSMGEGMDLQADTVAIHNMDVPWTPAALEQRNGRGLRQGNNNELVDIFYYQTKGSLDAFMFGKLAVKDKWNQNLWLGKEDTMSNSLNNDEVEGVDYEDLSKNLTVDRETLNYWKAVRERDIETGLQAERAKQMETLESRIESRRRDIGHSQQMIKTYQQRLAGGDLDTQLQQDRIDSHNDSIQSTSVEMESLQRELDAMKAAQEQGKTKLTLPPEPGAAPAPAAGTPQVPAMPGMAPLGIPRSLGSAAASDFEGQEPPAETLQPDIVEDPAGVDQALAGQPPEPPRPPKKTKGGQPEKPGKGFSFENKGAEERYRAARKGITGPGLVDRGREFLKEIWASMTTEFEHLPKTPQFSRARYELHRIQKQSAVAQDRAIRIVEDIARPMDDVDLEIFQRAILLRDLAREDAAGHALPFGFEPGEPQKELDRLQPILEARERAWSGIIRRQSIWEGIKKDYTKAMADIGFNVADRLKNEDYFRHQVLLYANGGRDFRVRGGGLRTPSGRGFLKKRTGSSLDINANYAQAEFEVMAQMMKDIEVAKAIRIIKDTYDIARDLKAQAKQMNQKALEDIMGSEQPVKMIGLQPVGPTELQMRQYGQNIAYGFKIVYDTITAGQLDPELARKWASVISNMEAHATAADIEGPSAPEAVTPSDPGVFKFLAELAGSDGPGSKGARVIFKAVAARKEFMKTTLGEAYREWRDIVPESHRLWQPREGNIFYFVDTVAAKLAAQIHNEVAESVGITKQDLSKALAQGGPRAEFVLPVQLADALDAFNSPVPESRFGEALRVITGKWKQWQLISPRRVIRYNLRNISGDADAVFVGNPDAFRFVPEAMSDLRPVFFSMKTPEGEIREFFIRGGFETTLRAQEVADLKDVEILSRLFEEKDKNLAEKGIAGFKAAWNKVALATDFRETILRYAAYRSFLAQLEGEGLKSYGASIKENVDALPDNRDKAFKLANDLLGAYDEVSVAGQWLREHLIPFWSWKEVNFRRYVQFFKNATMDADEEMASRMARQLGSTGVKQGARAAGFLLKATAAWVLMELYNHMVHPDEEAELDAFTRNRPHIILWREADGKVAYFSGLGAVGDVLSWFGLDAAPLMVKDFLNGKRTALEVAKEMGKAPFNIVAQGITPLIKMPAEMAAQKQFFPDVFSPRPMRDNAQYLFRSVALGDEYNALFNVPSRGYIDSLKNMLYYRMDPGQGAYLDIANLKRKFMAKNGIAYDGGHTTPKGEALYNYKLALRYEDKDLAGRFLKQYVTLGGKANQLKQSLINMGPMAGLSMRDRAQFLHTLNQDDRIRLKNAEHYWSEILLGRRKE